MTAFCIIAVVALASCRQLSGVSDFTFRGEEGGGGQGGDGAGGFGGSSTTEGTASSSSTTGGAGGMGGELTWTRRRGISLDLTMGPSINDFPLLVVLTPDRIDYASTQDQGQDLRFRSTDQGLALSHEIEVWNKGGVSLVWVKVPDITPLVLGVNPIQMYYGAPGAPDGQDVKSVWSPNFRGVWHLGGALSDSSDFNKPPQDIATVAVPARVGLGRKLVSANGSYIDTNFATDLTAFTVEMWAFGEYPSTNGWGPEGPFSRDKNFEIAWSHPDSQLTASVTMKPPSGWVGANFGLLNKQEWYYLAGTYDGATLRAFKNGALLSQQPTIDIPEPEVATAKIGRHATLSGTMNFFDGIVDEARISAIPRSSEWIAAQYKSMTDAGGVLIGAEQAGAWALP